MTAACRSCTRKCCSLRCLPANLQPCVHRQHLMIHLVYPKPAHSPPIPCRNIRQYPEAAEESGLLLVRLDAPLYFANVQYVRDRLRKYELRSQVTCDDGSSRSQCAQ